MKQGLLLIFLLGYGHIAPLSCSKKHASDDPKRPPYGKEKKNIAQPKQMVLFAPKPVVKPAQKV